MPSRLRRVRAAVVPLVIAAAALLAAPAGYAAVVAEPAVVAGYEHSCSLNDSGDVKCWGANNSMQLGTANGQGMLVPGPNVSLGSSATSIAVGRDHTCAALTDGSVKCWGFSGFGQTGVAVGASATTPNAVPGLGAPAVKVVAGEDHSCALLNDAKLKCWGANDYGQLGIGNFNSVASATEVTSLGSNVLDVAAGGTNTCAVLTGGAIKCWGDDSWGQLGNGAADTGSMNLPDDVDSPAGTATGIAVGNSFACANEIVAGANKVECWGSNASGQLGDGLGLYVSSDRPTTVAGLPGTVVTLSTGQYFACALIVDGDVFCWGSNYLGELGGNALTQYRDTPGRVLLGAEVIGIGAGNTHACAILVSGTVRCWGSNAQGEAGDGTSANVVTPASVSGITGSASMVASGADHSCAKVGVAVECWGANDAGQLGDGTNALSLSAVDVSGLGGGAVETDLGQQHSCATIDNTGDGTAESIECWGNNSYGELGDGTTNFSNLPVPVSSLAGTPLSVSVGDDHTCAILNTDTDATGDQVACWGDNSYGQLGDGTTNATDQKVTVVSLGRTPLSITAGYSHTCAIMDTGGSALADSIKCWGYNGSGELGDNSFVDSPTPVTVSNLGGRPVSVAAGYDHTCAIVLISGIQTARCWGANYSGQLGDGTVTESPKPVTVISLGGAVSSLDSGTDFSCARMSGVVKCWGMNRYGELGQGYLSLYSSTPVTVPLAENAVSLATGQNHSCAVSESGGVKCWGGNSAGQTGQTMEGIKYSPATVSGLVLLENPPDPVDTTVPVVTITAPVNNSATTDASVVLEFSATDDSGVTPNCTRVSGAVISLNVGANTLSVTCTDGSGNGTTASVLVTRNDVTPPSISGITPVDGSTVVTNSITLDYTVTDNSGAAPTCTPDRGTSINLVVGSNQIEIDCADGSGNHQVVSLTITYTPDTAPPVVSMIAPLDNSSTADSSVIVSYSVTDNSGVEPVCNIVDGTSVALVIGDNAIVVTCQDADGNQSPPVTTRVVRLDVSSPSVQITAPVDGSTTNTPSAQLTFTAADDSGSVVCDRTSPAAVPLVVGLNTLSVSCSDAAGNTTLVSVDVTYQDASSPVVTIVSPVTGATLTSSPATLIFSVTDDSDLAPSCSNASGSSVSLNAGSNNISVTCTDASGNQGSDTVVVTYLPPAIGPPASPAPTPTEPPGPTGPVAVPLKLVLVTSKVKRAGVKVSVPFIVVFRPPAGANAASCGGTMTLSGTPAGRKAVTVVSKPGAVGLDCTVFGTLKLPKAAIGNKVTFTARFAGNGLVMASSQTASIKLKKPRR